jgi:hypothetical protein
MNKSKKRSETVSDRQPSIVTAGDNRDRIAARAYELYLKRGASHGGDVDDWIAAERELNAQTPSRSERGE